MAFNGILWEWDMRSILGKIIVAGAVFALALGTIGCGDDGTESGSTGGTTGGATGGTTGGTTGGDSDASVSDTGPGGGDSAMPEGDVADEMDTGGGATTGTEDTAKPPEEGCAAGFGCNAGQCCSCSPVGCENGIDNSLSGLAGLANSSLQGSINDGQVNLVAELAGDTSDGVEFDLNMYNAELDEANADCDVAEAECDWILGIAAFTDDCSPLIAFDNAMINGDVLTAGGPDGVFALAIPIQGLVLELTVTLARIEGTVEKDADGNITKITGLLAGAIPKSSLEEAVDNLPAEGLPIPKESIKSILDNVVKADIDGLDADGNPGQDGVVESASVSILFEGIPANITGVEEVPEGQDPPPLCDTPPETFSEVAFRINSLQLGDSGKVGQGLDVDEVCRAPDADQGELCSAE